MARRIRAGTDLWPHVASCAWGASVLLVLFLAAFPARAACPIAPTPVASTNNCSGIIVSWTPESPVDRFEIVRTHAVWGITVLETSLLGSTYTDTSAVVGEHYTYTLLVKRFPTFDCPGGTGPAGSPSNPGSRPTPPSPPVISDVDRDCNVFSFDFHALPGVQMIRGFRGTSAVFTEAVDLGTASAAGPSPTFEDAIADGVPGITYYYWFRSENGCAVSAVGAPMSSGTLSSVPVRSAPTLTVVSHPECGGATVSWTAVPHANEYLLRVTVANGGPISTHIVAGLSFFVPHASSAQHTYSVFARNVCGNGPVSTTQTSPGTPRALITGQPLGCVVNVGDTATLSVGTMVNPSTLSYEWRRNGQPLLVEPRIAGTNTPTLTISGVRSDDEALYTVRVWDVCYGELSLHAVVAVRAACSADADESGSVSADDIFFFLDRWFAQQGMPCP